MPDPISIKPFEWAHWAALWQLVGAHLAEHGIVLDPEDMVLGFFFLAPLPPGGFAFPLQLGSTP